MSVIIFPFIVMMKSNEICVSLEREEKRKKFMMKYIFNNNHEDIYGDE